MAFLSSLTQSIKNSLTPITDQLREQFGIGAKAPSATPLPQLPAPPPAPAPASTSTPMADQLRTQFNIGAPAAPTAPSLYDRLASESAGTEARLTAPSISPFLSNVLKSAGLVVHNAAAAADSFAGDQTKNLQDFASGKLTLHPDDWVKGLEDTGLGALKLTTSLAQGINQGVLRIGTSIASATLPGYAEEHAASPEDPILKDVAGEGKVDSYQKIFTGADQWAQQKGAGPITAKTFAGFTVLGTLLMDDPGFAGGEKALFGLSKDAAKQVAEATSEDVVKTLIKQENPHISDKALEFVTPLFTDAKTPEEVASAIKFVQGSEQTAIANADKRATIDQGKTGYTPPAELNTDQIAKELGQYDTPQIKEARAAAANATPTLAIDTEERNALREALVHETYGDGAAQQGRRLDIVIGAPASGKSTIVEDLARKHGSIVPDADSIKKQLPEYGAKGEGSQIVHTESTALAAQVRALARERGDNTVLQMVGNDPEQIKKHIQIYKDNGYDVHLHLVELAPEKAAARAAARYAEGGHFVDPEYILRHVGLKPSIAYDTVKNDERLSSFEKLSNDVKRGENPALIERSSQGKAEAPDGRGQRSPSGGPGSGKDSQGKEVSTNLLKSLGASKNPYEVLNILKNEYRNLPDVVLDKLVERFVRTKRIANIENLIRAADNLNLHFSPSGDLKLAGEQAEKKLPAAKAEVLDKTVPDVARRMMRQDQKESLIRQLKNKFDDPKAAVAAEHEYNRIWDDVNQKIVDEYENLTLQKSFLEDVLSSNDGAATLFKKFFRGKGKDVSDPTQELMEIMNRAQKKKRDLETYRAGGRLKGGKPTPLTKAEQDAIRLDTLVHDLGFHDLDAAQTALEQYVQTRKQILEMGATIKEMRPRVREARILQEGLSEIAVIPMKDVQAIDRLISVANVRDYFKDISGFAGQTRDIYRNFEKFFGKLYPQIKKAILDPFDESKAARVDEVKKLGDELDEGVVSKFGIKRGSKESAAIQRYADTDLPEGERLSHKDLVQQFGKAKADNIVAADVWFRKTYDDLIDQLNEVRRQIYPNNPAKLIAKRKNYYRHFREMNDTWGDALREFFDTPAGIAPGLVGKSEFTKAKTRFLPFAEQRLGQKTTLDAVGGFLEYAELYAYAKHIDPNVSRFRYLQRKIAEVAPRAGEELKMPDGKTFKSKGAENFLGYLDDFSRDLTGNTNPLDRYVQKIIPGGRKTMRASRFLNNRIKANTILGNLGSAVAQIANVPQGIADTKLYSVKGMQRTLASTVMHNEPMAKSLFLKERYQSYLKERFPFSFADKPFRATSDQVKKQAAWLMQKVDEVGTRFIWNSEYEKALGKGIEDPIKYADDRTRRMVAGRGVGEVPLAQKAVTSGFAIPFTLEVGNAWWVMKDFVDAKDMPALMTFFVANYLLNEASQKVRGSRITYDPINAFIEGAQSLSSEYKSGHLGRGVLKLLGREAGEALENIPGGQQLAAIVPDAGVQSGTQLLTGAPMTKQEIFGQSTAGRFGTPLIVSGLQDAVYRVLPPLGGLQIKKTYQGLLALVKGQAEDSKGNPTFTVPRSPQNLARALLFGANATSEATKYFNNREDLFQAVDRQTAETFMLQAQTEKTYADYKNLVASGKGSQAADLLQKQAAKDPQFASRLASIVKAEKMGLNGNDRLIGMLNVSNGERAKYLAGQLKKMKTGQQRAAYLQDLAQKKLLTGQVAKQMAVFMKN